MTFFYYFVKYKLASAVLLLTKPCNVFPPAFTHFINSALMVSSSGLAFTFLSKVDDFKLAGPKL
jgi:hypothetical protein